MRMGKLGQQEKVGRGYPGEKPEFSSAGMTVGSVSSNWVNSVFLPEWEMKATEEMEEYIQSMVNYEEAKQMGGNETDFDEPEMPIFHSQFVIDDFKDSFQELVKEFSTLNNWKIAANAAKFERQLDEKYGVFRPFVEKYPQVERFIRNTQRKYAMGEFSPFRQTGPPIALSTSVIILFMMQRNKVSWQIMLLSFLFLLVGLQPWALVALCILGKWLTDRRKRMVIGKMDSEDIPDIQPYYKGTDKKQKLMEPVGEPLGTANVDGSNFDTIIVGHGPGTLYTAALLSRSGRKVLVLSSPKDASGCLTLETSQDSRFKNVPFDCESSNISRIQRQQELLAPALCTSTDFQGGIRFAQIGTDADGHAFEILSIPGMGANKSDDEIPFVLRGDGGIETLMQDTASYLGDGWAGTDDIGNSLAGAYYEACLGMNVSASEYYLTKILPDKVNDFRSVTTYGHASVRYAQPFLDQCFPLNAHLRSLFAGMGMKGENLRPGKTSMAAHVTNVCAAIGGEGMYYPVGGPRALCHALATVVEQCGGKVVTGAPIKELLFEEKDEILKQPTKEGEEAEYAPPQCVGVVLADNTKISLPKDESASEDDRKVITTSGFVDTFIRFTPGKIRDKYKVPRGLPALSERRPVFKILFSLDGSAADLDISGADFYRLPGASLAIDESDPVTGAVRLGEIGSSDGDGKEEEVSTDVINAAESSAEKGTQKQLKQRKSKYFAGKSWLQISFPSAKDPSFEERHGRISTCVVTIEADDDFVTLFDTKPKIFSMLKKKIGSHDGSRLIEQARKDLIDSFPQLEDKIIHAEVRGPFSAGLSHNPERFAAKGIRADTPYAGLYCGGSDLTVADSFGGSVVSGWLVANSVMGYTTVDLLFLGKTITSDLVNYVETPDTEDEAVPCSSKVVGDSILMEGDAQSPGEGSKKEN